MTLEYKSEAPDLVNYLLFNASRNARIKKSRRNGVIIVPLVYLGLGLVLVLFHQIMLAGLFAVIAAGWYLIYPLWQRRHYVRHYTTWVQETYKSNLGKLCTVQLSPETLIVKDEVSEMKILTSQFTEVHETALYIFVLFSGGGRWIVPKERTAGLDELKALAKKLNIPYHINYEWKWR